MWSLPSWGSSGLFLHLAQPLGPGPPNTFPFWFCSRVIARHVRRRWRLAWGCVTMASCITVIQPSPQHGLPRGWGGVEVCPETELLAGTLVPGACFTEGKQAQRQQVVGWPAAQQGSGCGCQVGGRMDCCGFGLAHEFPSSSIPSSALMQRPLQVSSGDRGVW